MKAAHTPGAWVYGKREDGSLWLSIGDVDGPGAHYQADLCASEADARLIAAAPALLTALVALMEMNNSDNRKAARAAIATAIDGAA